MDWYDLCLKYHEITAPSDWSLESLPHDWQRELAALWRLEADINNGGYLQFICNWGMSNHAVASAALYRIAAFQMQAIVDSAYLIASKYVVDEFPDWDKLHALLPQDDYQRIMDLSYEFMEYPDDIESLGSAVFGPLEGQ